MSFFHPVCLLYDVCASSFVPSNNCVPHSPASCQRALDHFAQRFMFFLYTVSDMPFGVLIIPFCYAFSMSPDHCASVFVWSIHVMSLSNVFPFPLCCGRPCQWVSPYDWIPLPLYDCIVHSECCVRWPLLSVCLNPFWWTAIDRALGFVGFAIVQNEPVQMSYDSQEDLT